MLASYATKLRVIALSMHPEFEKYALDAGVDAFVYKANLPEYLLEAFEQIVKDD